MTFIGFLSHLSTCLVEVVQYLQDELYLGNESSFGLTCSLCAPNKSSISTLMNKNMYILENESLNVFLSPAQATGAVWGAVETNLSIFLCSALTAFCPRIKFLLLKGLHWHKHQGASMCSVMHLITSVGGLEISESCSGHLKCCESC